MTKLCFTTGAWDLADGLGCVCLLGLLDQPLDTDSLDLPLFSKVCAVGNKAEFGNPMLSKLKISEK